LVQAKAVMGGSLLCSLNFLLPSLCQFSLAEKEMANWRSEIIAFDIAFGIGIGVSSGKKDDQSMPKC
jgi:hypothetical protein